MSSKFLDNKSFLEIGEFFKNHRIKVGYTQADIAKTLNVTVQFISNSERGVGTFPPSVMKKMIDTYSIRHNEFYQFMTQVQSRSLKRLLGSK